MAWWKGCVKAMVLLILVTVASGINDVAEYNPVFIGRKRYTVNPRKIRTMEEINAWKAEAEERYPMWRSDEDAYINRLHFMYRKMFNIPNPADPLDLSLIRDRVPTMKMINDLELEAAGNMALEATTAFDFQARIVTMAWNIMRPLFYPNYRKGL